MLDLVAAVSPLGQPFTTAAAASAGLTADVLARGVRRGLLVRPTRGCYLLAGVWSDAGPRGQHLLLVAALASVRPGAVVTHHSAALLHGMPMPIDCPRFVSLTTDHSRRTSAPTTPDRLRNAALPADHVTQRSGLRVTTPGPTVVDCLRELPLADAVAVADAAVREGLTTVPELRRLRHQQRRWPGIRGADDGIPLIDPLRETWLESFSFTRLWQLGVPLPECQVSVYDARGRFVGRVDGIWREHGTVAEADGAGKYLGELTLDGPSGAAAARLVLAEKIREDRLRDTGLEVVRWGFQDVRRAAPDLVQRVEAAWERGDPGRFRGRLVSASRRGPEAHFVPVTRQTTADPAPERRLRSTKWV